MQAGIFPQEAGRLYHRLFSMRQTGDYDDTYDVTAEDVLPNVEPTGKLIDDVVTKAKELINETRRGIKASPKLAL